MRTNRLRSRQRQLARGSLLFVAVLFVSAAAHAASIFEFGQWMQRVEKRALSVQRDLDRADGTAGASDAREIEALYRKMEDYFVLMGDAPRAVELSKKGRQDAGDLATRAAANDFEGARPIIKSMMEDCRTCHREYKPLT